MEGYSIEFGEARAIRKRSSVLGGLLVAFLILVVLGCAALTIGAVILYHTLDLASCFGAGGAPRPVNLLFVGTDRSYDEKGRPIEGVTRADTIILVSLNPIAGKSYIVSIPRDTRAMVPGYGIGKVNVAHALGGADLTVRTVEEMLGVTIDGYVETDFRGFVNMVDVLGGVDIDVEKDLHYIDRAGNLKIDIKAGHQHLDGYDALGYVRFRHDSLGDVGRVARQQKFLAALFAQALRPQNLGRYREVMKVIQDASRTDLTPRQLAAVGVFLWRTSSKGEVETHTLPGHFSPIYWLPDEDAIRELMDRIRA